MTTTRYCPRCAEEVEDTGGFCLLGHKLSLDAPVASIQELRDEVERAFEEARIKLGLPVEHRPVPVPTGYSSPQLGVPSAGHEEVVARPQTIEETRPEGRVEPAAAQVAPAVQAVSPPPAPPVASPAPPPAAQSPTPTRLRRTPPPPPPPRAEIRRPVIEWVEEDVDMTSDPMAAFAPPPRMDWGPERAEAKSRKGLRRLRPTEA